MLNLRGAQVAANKIESLYACVGSIAWSKVYASEADLVDDLRAVHVPDKSEWCGAASILYRGYEYIHSFAKRVQMGAELTEAQMRQAKRLAKEIKKAAAVAGYYNG